MKRKEFVSVSIEDKRESRTTAGYYSQKEKRERKDQGKNMTNDQSADHRRRIRLLLVFCEMKLNESKKYQTGGVVGPEGGPFTHYGQQRLD